jgi:sulfur carrier protein
MQIAINNESYTFDENTSLENAIETLELKETNGIALALNEEIIPRSEWQKTILYDEDKIIIIGAVAGG